MSQTNLHSRESHLLGGRKGGEGLPNPTQPQEKPGRAGIHISLYKTLCQNCHFYEREMNEPINQIDEYSPFSTTHEIVVVRHSLVFFLNIILIVYTICINPNFAVNTQLFTCVNFA